MTTASDSSELLWFQDVLVRVGVSSAHSADAISLLEFHARPGVTTPLHIHHTHDEVFRVLEGQVTWRVADNDLICDAGDTLLAPKGIPHAYRVSSDVRAK